MDLPKDWASLEALLRAERHESAAIEWKEGVANSPKVARTLVAFANDIERRGGGMVICGLEETKAADGTVSPSPVGLDPARMKELRKRIPDLLRDHAVPALTPECSQFPLPDRSDREILIFAVTASPNAHHYTDKNDGGTEYWIRIGEQVQRAGTRLDELYRLKRQRPPLLSDIHPEATLDALDRLAVREILEKQLKITQPWERYLEPDMPPSAGIPSLVTRRPGDRAPVPRNFALLLFCREPRRFLPGAYAVLSEYPDTHRAGVQSELFPDLSGSLLEVIDDALRWLHRRIGGLEVDKTESVSTGRQNRPRYPRRAIEEAVVNAFVHRDYARADPVRITLFSDRLEITSPGGLEGGDLVLLRQGQATASWRNKELVDLMIALGRAQTRGEGIPVILQETRQLSGREPEFEVEGAPGRDFFKVTIFGRIAREASRVPGLQGGDALIVVAMGAPTIREQVLAALPALGIAEAPIVVDYSSDRYLESASDDWFKEATRLRDELRPVVERAEFAHFHLFYRGPVVLAPLIGALIARIKPLTIYTFENGRYEAAYTLDKRFLQG